MLKQLKGWRTFAFSAAITVLALLDLFQTLPLTETGLIPAEHWPWVLLGIGVASGLLRIYTSTPPFMYEHPAETQDEQ